MDNLYQQEYRHFLYIAQAPYSSTLRLTKSEQDEELFFMSPTLISFLKSDHPDIKIYPVFFENTMSWGEIFLKQVLSTFKIKWN